MTRNLALALGMLCLVALLLLALCGGPDPKPGPASTPAGPAAASAMPNTEAGVTAFAKAHLEDFVAGDYGLYWDGWTSEAKTVITRAEYERLFTLCPSPTQGVPFTVKSATLTKDGARVRVERATFLLTETYVYEAGLWRYQPGETKLAEYAKGADAAAKARKAKGLCADE